MFPPTLRTAPGHQVGTCVSPSKLPKGLPMGSFHRGSLRGQSVPLEHFICSASPNCPPLNKGVGEPGPGWGQPGPTRDAWGCNPPTSVEPAPCPYRAAPRRAVPSRRAGSAVAERTHGDSCSGHWAGKPGCVRSLQLEGQCPSGDPPPCCSESPAPRFRHHHQRHRVPSGPCHTPVAVPQLMN